MPQNGANPLTPGDVLRHVLVPIKAFHPPQDVGDATVAAWTAALHDANVTNIIDARTAIIRFYNDPAVTETWMKPRDVVRGVQAIRMDRLRKGPTIADVSRDLDPEDPQWAKIVAERMDAVADGRPIPHRFRAIDGGAS